MFIVTLMLTTLIYFAIYNAAQHIINLATEARTTTQNEPHGKTLFQIAIVCFTIITWHKYAGHNDHGHWFAIVIGIPVIIIGLVISLVAIGTLGRNWVYANGLHTDHHLVRHGLYGTMRHPEYFGRIISIIGLAIFSWSIWFAIACLFGILFLLSRIPGEEIMMEHRFQGAYRTYRDRTGRFMLRLPRLRRRRGGRRGTARRRTP